jgi:hypothetical protein
MRIEWQHMTVVLSFFFKKKKEVTAMNSYANSDALSRTSGVVEEKETKRDETSRKGRRIRNKKAIYMLRSTSSGSFLSCLHIYIYALYNEYVWYLHCVYTEEQRIRIKIE